MQVLYIFPNEEAMSDFRKKRLGPNKTSGKCRKIHNCLMCVNSHLIVNPTFKYVSRQCLDDYHETGRLKPPVSSKQMANLNVELFESCPLLDYVEVEE